MISWNDKASPHGYPTAQRAAVVVPPTPRPTLLSERGVSTGRSMTPRSESSLVHWLAFRLVDGARRWRVTL